MLIVSLTSLPTRIAKIISVIECLLNQTHLPDLIIIYLPKTYRRLKETLYEIPSNLLELMDSHKKLLAIRYVEKDWGPITKIVPALQEFTNEDDIIITVDDDIILEKHFIEEFLDGHKEHPNTILGFMGTTETENGQTVFYHAELVQQAFKERRLYKDIINGSLGGYRGILYPRKLLKDDFFKILTEVDKLHEQYSFPILDDDLFMSLILSHFKIPRKVIGTFFPGNLSANSIYQVINIKILKNDDGVNNAKNIEYMQLSREIIRSYFEI